MVYPLAYGIPRPWSLGPCLTASYLHESRHCEVVVYQIFLTLYVTLTWHKDIRTSILKHGEKVWHDNAMREKVLCGAEYLRTLPLPHACLRIEITPMAWPYAQMASLQTIADFVGG